MKLWFVAGHKSFDFCVRLYPDGRQEVRLPPGQ
jgi:hypothetical protein